MNKEILMMTYDNGRKIPVRLSVIDALVRKEVAGLGRKTGLPVGKLLIEYERGGSDQKAIAYFSNCLPYKLVFNLTSIEKYNVNFEQLMGIVQHEFAHYVQKLRYDIDMNTEEGHGPDFKKACREVGCADNRYFRAETKRLFKY